MTDQLSLHWWKWHLFFTVRRFTPIKYENDSVKYKKTNKQKAYNCGSFHVVGTQILWAYFEHPKQLLKLMDKK